MIKAERNRRPIPIIAVCGAGLPLLVSVTAAAAQEASPSSGGVIGQVFDTSSP